VSFLFNPKGRLIFVRAEIVGPVASQIIRLALDTGSTRTAINRQILETVGYDSSWFTSRFQMTTASGSELADSLSVQTLRALGQERVLFPVICHSVPKAAGVDGLLGLDFFQDLVLTINFRSGRIDLR
jgi:predicted aspartyl protease